MNDRDLLTMLGAAGVVAAVSGAVVLAVALLVVRAIDRAVKLP